RFCYRADARTASIACTPHAVSIAACSVYTSAGGSGRKPALLLLWLRRRSAVAAHLWVVWHLEVLIAEQTEHIVWIGIAHLNQRLRACTLHVDLEERGV